MAGTLQETATEIAARFPMEREAIGTDKNPLYLLCSTHPNMAPGRIRQIAKRSTARELFRRKPVVKRMLWSEHLGRMGTMDEAGRASKQADRRTIRPMARSASRRSPAAPTIIAFVIPCSLLRGASLDQVAVKFEFLRREGSFTPPVGGQYSLVCDSLFRHSKVRVW